MGTEVSLDTCPWCGGHVQFWINSDGEVSGICCKSCRIIVKHMDPEYRLKSREPYDAQMQRWADHWNKRV